TKRKERIAIIGIHLESGIRPRLGITHRLQETLTCGGVRLQLFLLFRDLVVVQQEFAFQNSHAVHFEEKISRRAKPIWQGFGRMCRDVAIENLVATRKIEIVHAGNGVSQTLRFQPWNTEQRQHDPTLKHSVYGSVATLTL